MAFITTEQVKNIRTQLKAEFKGIKFSVKKINYSKVSISILSSEIDFFGDCIADRSEAVYELYMQVNRHSIDDNFKSVSKKVLKRISEIAHSQGYYDNSDAMTDYFDTAYYVNISVGSWDKEYKLINEAA